MAGRLTAAQLSYFQAAFTRTCDHLATVKRNTSLGVPNADGSVPQTLTTVYTDLAALVQEPTGSYAQQLAAALVDQATWEVFLPATDNAGNDLDVRRGDTVIITTMSNLTLTVQHVLHPESNTINTNFLASKPR